MNVFATYECPIKSAKYLDLRRRNKMTLESAQLMATAIQLNGGDATYKITHKNHPATKLCASNRANYRWILRHFSALCRDYTKRTGKIHGCQKYIKEFISGVNLIPDGELEFVNCAANDSKGISFKHLDDVFLAYRLYLRQRWKGDKIKPRWV